MIIRLGEYDFTKPSDSRQEIAVDTIFMHEKFDLPTYTNDVALIRLKKKVTFNDRISPICLPPANTVMDGHSAYVVG